jgi:hypothetical protein
MLKSLKFVQGSVAKKDFLPALTHFVIEYGKVRGFNGVISLCSPIPFDIACRPKADTLIKAIAACDDTISLSLTPAGKLTVKAGKFRTHIACVQEITTHPLPEGEFMQLDGASLLAGLKAVEPFIGTDASRKWANGVLIRDGSLFATNNVMVVQYWVGNMFQNVVNLPSIAVKEILRINEPPLYAQVAQGSITFHYEGDRWLRTQLYDTDSWPDLAKILDRPSVQKPIEEGLFEALEVIRPFVGELGTIIFQEQGITTHTEDNEGATFDVPEFVGVEGRYKIVHLELLKGAAKTIDWSGYPGPCMFQNDRLRGAIIGVRA